MKMLLLAATAALTLSTTMVSAQTPPPETPPASTTPPAEAERRPEAPPATAGTASEQRGSADTSISRSTEDRAARFRVESGETVIDFQCAEGEPTKDCADLLVQVLDRLQADNDSADDDRRDYNRDRFGSRSREYQR